MVLKTVGYCDVDWAGDLDRKSTSGYLFQICGAAVSWRSKKNKCVLLCQQQRLSTWRWLVQLRRLDELTSDLKNGPTGATVIFEDNQSICMAQSPQFHGRTKHIGIKYRFIHEQVTNGTVELRYCRSSTMIADMLTNGLYLDQFVKLRQMAGVKEMPKHSALK